MKVTLNNLEQKLSHSIVLYKHYLHTPFGGFRYKTLRLDVWLGSIAVKEMNHFICNQFVITETHEMDEEDRHELSCVTTDDVNKALELFNQII